MQRAAIEALPGDWGPWLIALVIALLGFSSQDYDMRELHIARAYELKRRNIEDSGHKATPAELALLMRLERHHVDARVLVASLGECVAAMTEPSQAKTQKELVALRKRVEEVLDQYVPSSATPTHMIRAVQEYEERAPIVVKTLDEVRRATSEFRHGFYKEGFLEPSYEFEVVGTPWGNGSLRFAAESVLIGTAGQRVRVKQPILQAVPYDRRAQQAPEYARSRGLQPMEMGPDVFRFGADDAPVQTIWRKAEESFAWTPKWLGDPTAQIAFLDRLEEAPKRTGWACSFTLDRPVADVNFVVVGSVTWILETNRGESVSSSKETNPVAGTIRVRVYCI